jgi:hypothetical protein
MSDTIHESTHYSAPYLPRPRIKIDITLREGDRPDYTYESDLTQCYTGPHMSCAPCVLIAPHEIAMDAYREIAIKTYCAASLTCTLDANMDLGIMEIDVTHFPNPWERDTHAPIDIVRDFIRQSIRAYSSDALWGPAQDSLTEDMLAMIQSRMIQSRTDNQ